MEKKRVGYLTKGSETIGCIAEKKKISFQKTKNKFQDEDLILN